MPKSPKKKAPAAAAPAKNTTSAKVNKGTKKVWEKKSAVQGSISKKATRYYPAEDVKTKLGNHHNTTKICKLRSSITPGTILILLAGHFKGQRVVFLKQLPSGLLLITGPYAVNGVPIRRVPQSYVIATSTKVDISGVSIPAEITDATFKKDKTKKKKDDEMFFEKDKESSEVTAERKALQKKVDDKLVAEIGKTGLLKEYLSSKFSLKKGDK